MPDDKKLETVDIPGVEIFEEGTWNGDRYEPKDLQAMISAFDQVGFQPPIIRAKVKLGHADGQEDEQKAREVFGAPSLGHVNRIYKVGKKLLADLIKVPKHVAQLIKAGAYDRVSAEIYWDYKDGNKNQKYPRVLKAISFLGADIPALTNLKAIESLYKQNETGAFYAYDDNGNEYHAYDGMEMAPTSYRYPKKDKVAVKYVMANGDAAEKCSTCKFYGSWSCALVEGEISPQAYCDLYEPRGYQMDENRLVSKFREMLDSALSMFRNGDHEPKRYTIEKRGDEWCLISGAGKVLGCHDSREKAAKQEAAIKANMERGDVKVTVAEMRDICPSCAESMEAKNFSAIKIGRYDEEGEFRFQADLPEETVNAFRDKFNAADEKESKRHSQGGDDMEKEEFDKKVADEKAKIEAEYQAKLKEADAKVKEYEAKAAEAGRTAKEAADKEKQDLQGRLEKMEKERRADRFDSWYDSTWRAGKIAPAEKARVKAIYDALPEGAMVVAYARDDKTEIKEPLWETVKNFIEGRPSIFRVLSKAGEEPEQPGSWENVSEEVDAKARVYMKEKSEKDYKQALRSVLNADPDLNDRYMRLQQ